MVVVQDAGITIVPFEPRFAQGVAELIVPIQRQEFGIAISLDGKMFVKAAYRGAQHALARRLLDTLVAWAGSRGLREIYLGTTAKFLTAHRFYEKNSFAEIARADLPPAFPVMAVDTRFYRRHVGTAA